MKRKILLIIPIPLLLLAIAFKTLDNEPVLEPAREVGAASVDYFLKIPGVEGQSAREGHGDEMEIISWSWGESDPGVFLEAPGAGRGGALQVNMSDFNFVKRLDKASPLLMQHTASGRELDEATLVGVKEDGHQFLEIKLRPVRVTSYQTGGSSGDMPTDTFSLNFERIIYEYVPQNEDGSAEDTVRGSWDFEENQPVE